MQAVEERVCDQSVLRLLRVMLRAGVMSDGLHRQPPVLLDARKIEVSGRRDWRITLLQPVQVPEQRKQGSDVGLLSRAWRLSQWIGWRFAEQQARDVANAITKRIRVVATFQRKDDFALRESPRHPYHFAGEV